MAFGVRNEHSTLHRFDTPAASMRLGRLLAGAVSVGLVAGLPWGGAALATEVELRLESVFTGGGCGWWDYGCELPTTPVALLPQFPSGAGTVELDGIGAFRSASLSLEAHTRDGVRADPWSRALAPSDLELSDYWLEPGEAWGEVTLSITSFVNPDVFAGRITNFFVHSTESGAGGPASLETYSFATNPPPPGYFPLPCSYARLHVDADEDGEEDQRDRAPLGASDGSFGTRVDGAGRTIADFCSIGGPPRKRCAQLDFANDEPLRRRPRDCRFESQACVPAELMPAASPPPFTGPFCQGLPVFADADGDGESDLTDRCPASSSAPVDEEGCSIEQFCALESTATCRRADFANDEPGKRVPRDCRRSAGACRAPD